MFDLFPDATILGSRRRRTPRRVLVHSDHKLRWRPRTYRRAGTPTENETSLQHPVFAKAQMSLDIAWMTLGQEPVCQLLRSSSEEQINGEASHAMPTAASVLQLPFALASKGLPISEIGSTSRSRVFVEIRPTNNAIRGFLHIPSHSNRSAGTNEHAPSIMGTARSPAATTGWLHSHRQMPLRQGFSREKN